MLACQSGRTVGALGALGASIAFGVLTPAAVAGNASWAHQEGMVASNGAVTVKSLSGGSTAGTQNPTGAVAKANQTAATQPPTVIIQATGSAVPQCVTKLVSGTTRPAVPACGSGYTQVWSDQSASTSGGWYIDTCSTSSGNEAVYNINGSNLSFIRISNSSVDYRGFAIGGAINPVGMTGTNYSSNVATCSSNTYTYAWAASLCCK